MDRPLTAVAANAEMELARRHFEHFLSSVKILEKAQPLVGVSGGLVEFQGWPHLLEFAAQLQRERLLVRLKARQIGFSWTVAAYAVWLMRFHPGATVLMFSRGQQEAYELLDKARLVYRNLPLHWQLPLEVDAMGELRCRTMESKIVAFPSTKDAGRSETATCVIQDEADFHEYGAENYLAVKPTIDAGGQMIMVSTVNKRVAGSLFKQIYAGAPRNGWVKGFTPWAARPGRDRAWYESTKASIPAVELKGLTPELYMEQEYPASEEEALRPAEALSVFDQEALREWRAEAVTARRVGLANIYQDYSPFRRGNYVAATDLAHGVGADYSVTVVLETRSGNVIADIVSNTVPPDQFSEESMKLLALYGRPVWAPEDNEVGAVALAIARRAGYSHLYRQEGKREAYGWHTGPQNRDLMWTELAEAVRGRAFRVYNRTGIEQFQAVMYVPHEGKLRMEAVAGAHDDYPMACAIAWQLRGARVMWGNNRPVPLPRRW